MIHVDRDPTSPEALLDEFAKRLIAEARGFYDTPITKRSQSRFSFSGHVALVRRAAMEPLMRMFHGKCAFCESQVISNAYIDVELFRPKSGAVGLDGVRSPDHYWWLALDWQNTYPVCAACNRSKGPRFPVVGERAPLEAGREDLVREAALLLDPCLDRPEDHLVFSDDGTVAAVHVDDLSEGERSRFGTLTRGQVTINTFSLNRSQLVALRIREAARFLSALPRSAKNAGLDPPALAMLAGDLLAPHESFLLMKRQLLAREFPLLASVAGIPPLAGTRDTSGELGKTARASKSVGEQHRAFQQKASYDQEIEASSVESNQTANVYRARAAYIERVEVHGFTTMQDFEFEFDSPDAGSGGDATWLMLLGENGVGKSSVLKAIALAIAGPRRLRELQEEVPMQNLPGYFHDDGYVRVHLTSQDEPLEVRREGDRLIYVGKSSGAKVFVRGFGPSRWFPLPGSQQPETDGFVRVESLFNPFVPLEPPEKLLAGLDSEQWEDVATSLKHLLQLPSAASLARTGNEVELHIDPRPPQPIRTLSSGYESIVAMAIDLMQLLFSRWRSASDAEGIVLLDEIGAHLHPRWRMRIVDSLRRTFPRVQFVATTHEPLCLRGLRQGEIVVMQRDDTGVVSFRPPQDISEFRIDQLLTSRMFGLHSTLAPELEEELDRYYALLSQHRDSLSPEDRQELDLLRETVGRRGILGATRRDQMIYKIIDEFIAREPSILEPAERDRQERLTADQVVDFWSRIENVETEGA